MNKKRFLLSLLMIFTLLATVSIGQVMKNGAKLGAWTMDYDAAVKLAKSKNLPLFLNFTGSDWCVWCKLMQEKVFSQKEWQDYAKKNLVLVTLDFPKDQSIVPDKYKERNQSLQMEMGVRGYPTFILLDSDGKSKLGQLGAAQDITPQKFIDQIKQTLKTSSASINRFAKTLSAKQGKAYKKYWAALKKTQNERDAWLATNPQQSEVNLKKFDEFNTKISDYQKKIRDIEVNKYMKKLSKADAAKYRELNKKLDKVQKELEAWLATRPERTEENTNKFMTYQSDIKQISDQIRSFEN